LEIRRLPERDGEEGGDEAPTASTSRPNPTFPQPPKPPDFKKVVTTVPTASDHKGAQSPDLSDLRFGGINSLSGVSKHLGQISAASRLLEQHRKLLGTSIADSILRGSTVRPTSYPHIEPLHLTRPIIPPKHDPEAFYYDWPAITPVKKGVLTCDLWRHQDSEEVFAFEVIFTKEGEVRGSILCSVHAENLSKPETARTSVARTIEVFRPLDLAQAMVEQCG
jgi:hypothetical protein